MAICPNCTMEFEIPSIVLDLYVGKIVDDPDKYRIACPSCGARLCVTTTVTHTIESLETYDEPNGDEPNGDEPDGDEPNGDEPDGDEPSGDEPGGDEPGGDEPAIVPGTLEEDLERVQYCEFTADRSEVYSLITHSEVALRYCLQVNDRPSVRAHITRSEDALVYCIQINDDPAVRAHITRSEDALVYCSRLGYNSEVARYINDN